MRALHSSVSQMVEQEAGMRLDREPGLWVSLCRGAEDDL